MDYSRLTSNIVDVLKEEQIKLGYQKEKVQLYYPLKSLNRFLGTRLHAQEMASALSGFQEEVKPTLGDVKVTVDGKRFCFHIPPEGTEYVHLYSDPAEFLTALIRLVEKHGTAMEEVLALFKKYSDRVRIIKMPESEDFDYLVYFEDAAPDAYRYCLTEEGGHVIYHRYTKEDYEDLFDTE